MANLLSLSVIGGADGPTAIFISGNPVSTVLCILAGAAIVGTVIWLIKKR